MNTADEFFERLWLVVLELSELAQFVDEQVIVVIAGPQRERVLILVVAGVQALFLKLHLDSILEAFVLRARLAEEQVHGIIQLIDLIRHNLVLILGALLRIDLSAATFDSRIHLGDLVDHGGHVVRCGSSLDHRALIEL